MLKILRKHFRDESGAVTVDWVVLTAGIVGLNIVVLLGMIEGGVNQGATAIYTKIDEAVGFIN
ncbi:Flp family type IVb pilin [Algicella marina]|uniref:Pilus assembly protein n=1 Tax=Algicella marina TaxID=2683284 RepID=A0A6P1T2A8_9RHOB|nr:hypothetical protein [Algicella marina]QHQ35930.1 hypothetical protein GO499_12490 [Algicella marina]